MFILTELVMLLWEALWIWFRAIICHSETQNSLDWSFVTLCRCCSLYTGLVTCHMSSFICHITPLLLNCQSQISEFFDNVNHSQCVMFHMSSVRFHVWCVMCHVSGGMCHSWFFHMFTPFKCFFSPHFPKSNVQTFWIVGILGEK